LRVVVLSAWLNFWKRRPEARLAQADPGVAHGEVQQRAGVAGLGPDREHHFAFLGELDGVAEDVEQDLAQPGDVAADRSRDVAVEDIREVELLLGGARADQVERRLDALAQVERMRLDVHPPGFDLREVEDVVDDRQQRIARIADRRRELALVVGERRVEEQAAHADHRVHRRADFVAHVCQEGALGLVRGFGRGARFLRCLKEPCVLDRDHGLVGEGSRAARPPCPLNALARMRAQHDRTRCRRLPRSSGAKTAE
jgi:hypothetical protein